MSRVIVVRKADGAEVARIGEYAVNLKPRLEQAILDAGMGGTVREEEDENFTDLVGLAKPSTRSEGLR